MNSICQHCNKEIRIQTDRFYSIYCPIGRQDKEVFYGVESDYCQQCFEFLIGGYEEFSKLYDLKYFNKCCEKKGYIKTGRITYHAKCGLCDVSVCKKCLKKWFNIEG
jgi:hypothetical protein